MRRLLLASFIFYVSAAQAFTVDTPLKDSSQEARARHIFDEVRCVVCQGQSLAESSAEVAADMRREIRKQVAAGQGDEAILNYLSQRYGEHIRMRPPFAKSMGLWLAPLVFLLAGFAIAFTRFKRRQA